MPKGGWSEEGMHCAATWGREVLGLARGDCSLIKLLEVTCSKKKLKGLFSQLVSALGRELENLVKRALKGQEVSHLEAKHITMANVLERPWALDRQLVQYVESARAATAGRFVMSVCTDKSMVSGHNLQNTAIVLPNNVGIVAPPQVPKRTLVSQEVVGVGWLRCGAHRSRHLFSFFVLSRNCRAKLGR